MHTDGGVAGFYLSSLKEEIKIYMDVWCLQAIRECNVLHNDWRYEKSSCRPVDATQIPPRIAHNSTSRFCSTDILKPTDRSVLHID